MSFDYLQKIPSATSIIEELPLSDDVKHIKKQRDDEIRDVFTRKSDKFILIIGPCSADNEDSVLEYVNRLAKLNAKVAEQLILIPRVYTNKPRTTGEGYKGMAHQPDPNEAPDLLAGLKAIRRLHVKCLGESHLSAADEMLYPANYPYLEDVLSYVAIGARSVENQQHRLTVSGLDIPCGMKNPTSGDLNVMLNSVKASQIPHTFIYHDWAVKTSGNPYAHCILRGAINQYGRCLPNYHYEDMVKLSERYLELNYANPTVIIDTNHANSNKRFQEQPRIALEVLQSMEKSDLLKSMVKGLMIESYLVEGAQKAPGQVYGQSITDPCLGWDDTKDLILRIADLVHQF